MNSGFSFHGGILFEYNFFEKNCQGFFHLQESGREKLKNG
jgi:hypothetical protein